MTSIFIIIKQQFDIIESNPAIDSKFETNEALFEDLIYIIGLTPKCKIFVKTSGNSLIFNFILLQFQLKSETLSSVMSFKQGFFN